MKIPLISLPLLVLLPVGGWLSGSHCRFSPNPAFTPETRKVLFYQDSMHPWVKSDQPGKCSVCSMDLTPIYNGSSGFGMGENMIVLNSNNVSVLHVQTEEARPQVLQRTLRLAGTLEANETRKTVVAAPAAGRIDELMVKYAGVEVREGEHLATFYSPELTLEKRRFLVRSRMSVQRDPTGGLAQTQSDTDPYFSDLICPQTGTVIERKVYKGQYVSDGEKLFTIVDLSVLWFRFDVYEQQLPWLAVGQTIQVSVPAVPGRLFPAVVTFIEPMLHEASRTFKVRADISNPLIEVNGRKQRLLGLGEYAEGKVRSGVSNVLAIPRSAVLSPGGSAWAYVERGNGAYERRRLKLGRQGDLAWEVVHGLEPGDQVVTSGNVLIDAQAQFNHATQPEESAPHEPDPAEMAGEPARMPALSKASVQTFGTTLETDQMGKVTEENESAPPERRASLTEIPGTPPSRQPTQPSTWAPGRRGPMRAPADTAGPSFRNNRLNKSDTMTAVFNRMNELRTQEASVSAGLQSVSSTKLTEAQCRKLQALLAAAGAISQSLSEDNLESFNRRQGKLAETLAPLGEELTPTHPWSGTVQRLTQAGKLASAQDLGTARKQFLPFSTAVVELAKQLRGEDPAFAGFKIYHCPMAPKPGLWLQSEGPLANPFYGADMLRCGEEVKVE